MKKRGILIIHGFIGSPDEVSILSNYLQEKGYLVSVPLLPGHGLDKDLLYKVKAADWIKEVEKAYLELSDFCNSIFVIGFSMGGLLAAHLHDYGISGLVTVNTPVYYWNVKQMIHNLFFDYRNYSSKYLNSGKGKPLNAMIQFQKLLSHTKPIFSRLNCYSLVLQTADDDTVLPRSSDYIFSKIKGKKRLVKIAKGGHQIFQSDSAQEVCMIIERYFDDFIS